MENILDRGADLIGAHQYDLIDILARETKGLLAYAPHGDAVGKHADALEGDALSAAQRFVHPGRVFRLHADDFHARVKRLRIRRDARDQAAAAHGNENGVDFIAMALAQDLHGNRALPGNDIGIIEGMHEHQVSLPAELRRMVVGMIVVIAVQYDFTAEIRDGLNLDFGRSQRHDDHRRDSPGACGERNPLGVVAGRGADDAPLRADGRQLRNLVVRAANFERKDRLQVFTFEPDVIVEASRQPRCGFERRLNGNVVDLGFENPIDVAFLDERHLWIH